MEWCKKLPKIELHAHLNGSVRDSTLLELAKEMSDKGAVDFDEVLHVIMKNDRSMVEAFKLFELIHLLTTSHETVTRITKEVNPVHSSAFEPAHGKTWRCAYWFWEGLVIEDFASENIVYVELRTTPKKNEGRGMSKRSYMEAVVNGMRGLDTVDVSFFPFNMVVENSESTLSSCNNLVTRRKIYVRLLLSIDRRESTAAAMETVELALEMRDWGVVGIDLSGNPAIGDWYTYLPALKFAREKGLAITLHCGEVPNQNEVQAMLDFLPHRIGHAIFLEKKQWRQLKSSKIPVEICLTSNLRGQRFKSIYDHHFADLFKIKHPIVLCTDDSGLLSTSLSNEYHLAATAFGISKKEMFQLGRNAIEFVFAAEEVKKHLRDIFNSAAVEF